MSAEVPTAFVDAVPRPEIFVLAIVPIPKVILPEVVIGDPDIVNSDIKDSMDLRIELNNRASWILDYAKYLTECIKSYGEKYEDTQKLPGYGVVEPFNIQYYVKDLFTL